MTARIEPVAAIDPGLLADAEAAAGGTFRSDANVYRTLATSPHLFTAWMSWGGHVVRRSALPPRLRELVILRVAHVARGRYPLVQHLRIGREVGLGEEALAQVARHPAEGPWSAVERAALCAVDQLLLHGGLDQGMWHELVDAVGIDATFDLVATAAFYRTACWMLNVARTPLDDGQPPPASGPTDLFGDYRAESVSAPRVELVPPERWPAELLADTESWPRFAGRPELRRAGVYCTLAVRAPLFRAVGPVMSHLLVGNALTDAQREVVIVRSCLHDRGAYPYRQHVRIAATAGVSDGAVEQLGAAKPSTHALDHPGDGEIVAAVDALHRDDDIDDQTYAGLATHLSREAIMDLVLTAGFYGLISFVLNSAATPLEPGVVTLAPAPIDKVARGEGVVLEETGRRETEEHP